MNNGTQNSVRTMASPNHGVRHSVWTHNGVSLARWLGTADGISGCEDSVESAFQQ